MSVAIREIFGREVVKLARKNKKILALTADLKNATKIEYFFKEFPSRSFEVGIARQIVLELLRVCLIRL